MLFFRLVKFHQKKYLRKIIFGQTKLIENNFTSRVWWALIEEMAGEKEIACVRGYHVYKDIWAAAIRKCWCVARSQPSEKFSFVKFIHVKYFNTFSVYEKIILQRK